MIVGNTISAATPDATTHITISELTLEALSGNVTLQANRNIILNNLTDNVLNMSGVGPGSTFKLEAGLGGSGSITATADVNDRFQTNGGAVIMTTTNGSINIGGIRSNGGAVTLTAAVRRVIWWCVKSRPHSRQVLEAPSRSPLPASCR